ncbi:hypothetical protein CQA01_25350 [Cyclobacterium qasimii]|nr:hypothetical protein CQA01_25350 [Cyclobacterium qasimii]
METHPFFISLTDMVYNENRQQIEIAQKIFWNDMETSLTIASGKQVNFLKPEDPKLLESLIKEYILENNKLEVDGKKLKLTYLGYEIEEDAAWFYMESEKIPEPFEVTIYNTILLDDFPTQQNIVNFYKNRKPKSLITRKDKISGTLELD